MLDERKVKLTLSLPSAIRRREKRILKSVNTIEKIMPGVHILYTVLWVTIGYIAVWALRRSQDSDT